MNLNCYWFSDITTSAVEIKISTYKLVMSSNFEYMDKTKLIQTDTVIQPNTINNKQQATCNIYEYSYKWITRY